MNNTPQIFYKKLEQNFEKRGYINLEQKEVNSKQDLVEISNIFNSKRYELFRIVYLKDNKIKGYETITSYLPNAVMVIKNTNKEGKRFFYKVQSRMQRLNANSYYLIHNHPSGVSYASNDDMRLTQDFMKNVKGFKGHLILGDNNYSFIEENKKRQLIRTEQIPYNLKEIQNISEKIDNYYNAKTLNPNLTEEQISFFENYKVNSRTALVNLMKAIDMKKDFSPVIFTNTKLKIMMILDIPNKMLNMSQQQLMGYFRNLAVLNGSTNVFLATQDKDVFKNCVKHFKYGSLADLIYYQNKDDKHIIMYEAPEMPKTSCLFKKPKISMNLASVSINKGTIKTNDNNSIYLNNENEVQNYIEIPAYEIKDSHYKDNVTVDKTKGYCNKDNATIDETKLSNEKAYDLQRKLYEEKLNNDEDNFDEPKKNQIRILLKRVGKKPLVKVINNTLEEKQKLVGGLIEVVDYDKDNLIIANEEGKVDGLKPNLGFDLDYIAGDCFFIGDDYQNASFKSLSLEDCERICKEIKNKSFVYDDRESPSKSKERER